MARAVERWGGLHNDGLYAGVRPPMRTPPYPVAPTHTILTAAAAHSCTQRQTYTMNIKRTKQRRKIAKQLLAQAVETLEVLIKNDATKMPISNIEICMVDNDGDGIGLQFKYDKESGEIEKLATPIEDNEFTCYDDDDEMEIEVELEDDVYATESVSKRLLN